MANALNPEVLRRFARLGAQARLEQIETERKAILSTFPDLVQRTGRTRGGTRPSAQAAAATPIRRRMTAAQRREVSERMKKYWAERKKKGGKE